MAVIATATVTVSSSVVLLSLVCFPCLLFLPFFCPTATCLENGHIIAPMMGNVKVMLLVVSGGLGKPSTGSEFQLLLLQLLLP